MKILGDLWSCLDIMWDHLGFFWILWGSVGFLGISCDSNHSRFFRILLGYMGFYGIL